MTHPTKIEQVAATIRTRHLNAQAAAVRSLTAAEYPRPGHARKRGGASSEA